MQTENLRERYESLLKNKNELEKEQASLEGKKTLVEKQIKDTMTELQNTYSINTLEEAYDYKNKLEKEIASIVQECSEKLNDLENIINE